MPERISWPGFRVYYFDRERTDELVLDCVRPALAATGNPGFFVRHWHRGPHVKLCLLLDGAAAAPVAEQIERDLQDYLARNPSQIEIHEPSLVAAHRELAVAERITEPLTPLATDNSVIADRYDRRLEVLGSEAAANLLEDFYRDTNDAVYAALREFQDGGDLRGTCITLMWTMAWASGMPLRRSFLSFRSHAEGFIMNSPNPEQTRRKLDDCYRSRAEPLARALRDLLSDLERGSSPPLAASVLAAIDRDRVCDLIANRHISLPVAGPAGQQEWEPGMLRHSPFHAALQQSPDYHRLLAEDMPFQVYRVLLNLLYLHLSRLGLTGLDRMMLAHLAACTVEEVLGVTALDLVSAR